MNSVNQSAIKHEIGLLNLAQELGNVSKACKMMGFSRDMFYRYQHAKEEGIWRLCLKPIDANPILETVWSNTLKMLCAR